jgi:DNA replication protein DnaC
MEKFSKVDVRRITCATHGEYESHGVKLGSRVLNWSACRVCAAAKKIVDDAKDSQLEAQQRQHQLEVRMQMTGIPLRYRNKGFQAFLADTDAKEKALATAMEFAQNFDVHRKKGTTMVFSGLFGTGKTHLALAIAQRVMHSKTVLYLSALDAVRTLRDTWRRDSHRTETQVLHELSKVDLLVLDEIGVQYGSEAEQVNLFDIIDKRYRDLMPTILLTNQNKDGIKEFLGDRSFDRLREGGIWVAFDGTSQRGNIQA